MEQTTEAIVRRKKREKGVLLPEKIRGWLQQHGRSCFGGCVQLACGFLMSFAELAGIPSGFGIAWASARAVHGKSMLMTLAGCLLALPMRLIWGLPPAWHMLLSLLMLIPAQRMLFGAGTARMMLWTGVSLLPGVVWACFDGTQRTMLLAAASVAVSVLAAPVMCRAYQIAREKKDICTVEEYLAVGYTTALLLCGGARMMLLGVNIGVFGVAALTLSAAYWCGSAAGCIMGVVSGAALALQGISLELSICLAAGGFLAGVTQQYGKRVLTAVCFMMTTLMAMYLNNASGYGAAGAVGASAVLMIMLPDAWQDELQKFAVRFGKNTAHHDAYAAARLECWQKTVEEIAHSMPEPESELTEHTAAWWRDRLCSGCPEMEHCACITTPTAAARADEVLHALIGGMDDAALEGLRGLGCARLYHLRAAMAQSAAYVREREKAVQRACYEHDMQATHLTALADAAKRLATVSSADQWSEQKAKTLMRRASEQALPIRLEYVRRINGHVQTAWRPAHGADTEALSEAIVELTSSVTGVPCSPARQEGELICVCEAPVYRVEAGSAARGKMNDCMQNGDTVRMSLLTGGRFLAILSDGMGHGADARRESGQTAALLQLCLEAGYTHEQALKVVNGMMLAATQGERFATVDLATVDLWNGDLTLDKLGAANSYLIRNDELTCLSGDALPLGILEQAESRTCERRLSDGDVLLMMSDGVEEAFGAREELEEAVKAAVTASSAHSAAKALLEAANCRESKTAHDDQTVVVLRIHRQTSNAAARMEAAGRYAQRTGQVYNRKKKLYNKQMIRKVGNEKDAEQSQQQTENATDAS